MICFALSSRHSVLAKKKGHILTSSSIQYPFLFSLGKFNMSISSVLAKNQVASVLDSLNPRHQPA
uniref:Uncharacterized protein n=1 Tax=Arundo donax TaxID=35708 RepID=A0A0A9BJY0_ARUDO